MAFSADNSLHLLLSMLKKTESGEARGRGQEMEQEADIKWVKPGNEDREWNTFLVVHAPKNKACL